MKTITLSLLFLFSITCNAMILQITATSIDSNISVYSGSQQWIDAKYILGGNSFPTAIKLYIWNNPNKKNIKTFFSISTLDFDNLPFNADGETKRIYFTIPTGIISEGSFSISINLYPQHISGILESNTTTSITLPEALQRNERIKYFSISGIEIEKPIEGFFIWKSENGYSGKVLINKE